MDAYAPGSLLAHLARIPDPRSPHGQRFTLTALLAAACTAILCGARSFAAIAQWGRSQELGLMHRLGFTRTPPTSGAYRYLFLRLQADDLEAALERWIAPLVRPEADQLRPTPMDGKTACGSHSPLRAAVHLLSLLDGPTGGVLRQTAVDAKTNEHKAALALLEGLVLEGRLVTADAMFCHRDVAERILEQGGHYFFAVKDNQETLRKDIQAAFEPAFSPLRGDAAARGGRHGAQHRPARGAGRSADAADDDATK
jgi:DDE family transposase